MNKIWVGCILTSVCTSVAHAQGTLSLEQRLEQMEQRLKVTEQRAAGAEAEIRALRQEKQLSHVVNNTPAAPANSRASAHREW